MPPQFASGATYSAPSTAAGILGPSPADSKVVCQLCNKAGHTAPACLALLALAEPSSGVMVNVREAWAKAFIPYSFKGVSTRRQILLLNWHRNNRRSIPDGSVGPSHYCQRQPPLLLKLQLEDLSLSHSKIGRFKI